MTGSLTDHEQGGFRARRFQSKEGVFTLDLYPKADLEKAYDSVNKEALGQVLGMCELYGKVWNGIKSIYVNSLACARRKGGASECFRMDNVVRQGSIMSPWLFTVYIDTVMKEVKLGIGRMRRRFLKEEREWRLPGLLYANDLVLCGESEEDLRAMVGFFYFLFL